MNMAKTKACVVEACPGTSFFEPWCNCFVCKLCSHHEQLMECLPCGWKRNPDSPEEEKESGI